MQETAVHWRTVLWRQARRSLPGLCIWIAVCTLLAAASYLVFEGWHDFASVARDPLWWVQRIGGSLIFWVVVDTGQYTPRWRSIPTILIPITGAGLSGFSLLGKHPQGWPVFVCFALFALGLSWLLIRRWRACFAADQRAHQTEAQSVQSVIPA